MSLLFLNMEWTKSETLKFIEHALPCLWNTRLPDNKIREKRRDALAHIAEQMGINIHAVEKKLLSLKTQYNREIKKIKTNPESHISWYAFENLTFLSDRRDSSTHFMVISENSQCESMLSDCNESPDSNTQQRKSIKRKHDFKLRSPKLIKNSPSAALCIDKQDEFSVFGETIANELRAIKSKQVILKLKKDIMNIVYDTKLKMLDSD